MGRIKPGKKTKRNLDLNIELARRASEIDLPMDVCELRTGVCDNMFVVWCHSVRRWKWGNSTTLPYEACRGCQKCHNWADRQGEAENIRLVQEAIAKREERIYEGNNL